mgnify:FL=1
MQTEIKDNIINIKNKINAACNSIKKDPKQITLIAVSKRKDIQMIEEAFRNGVCDFGENYAQELQEKVLGINLDNLIWHFIGPIQSNKTKIIAKNADWVHTLSREKIIRKLNSECAQIQKNINACIQVNISSEDSKSGCDPDNLIEIAKLIKSMKNISLKGIMALPKITNNEEEQKKVMELVLSLSKRLQSYYPDAKCISLGTTSDFENAIINGSTMIRVGESIFGKRL